MDLSDCVAAPRSSEVYVQLPSGAGTAPCALHQGSDSPPPPNAGFCFAFKISIQRGIGPPNDEDWRAGGCVVVFTLLLPQRTPRGSLCSFLPRLSLHLQPQALRESECPRPVRPAGFLCLHLLHWSICPMAWPQSPIQQTAARGAAPADLPAHYLVPVFR